MENGGIVIPDYSNLSDIGNLPSHLLQAKELLSYKPNNEKFLAFHKSTAKTRLLLGGKRCLPLDYKVLTANGKWVNIDDLMVGDEVLGVDLETLQATPTKVIGKNYSGRKQIYEIKLTDGTSCRASGEHEFPIYPMSGKIRHKWCYVGGKIYKYKTKVKVLNRTVDELIKAVNNSDSKKKGLIQAREINFRNSASLPIHPYLLGALIGDGSLHRNFGFTNANSDIVVRVNDLLMKEDCCLKYNNGLDWYIVSTSKERIKDRNKPGVGCLPFRKKLQDLGLCTTAEFKKIPDIYLTSDVESRKQLLAGLIDTDGFIDGFTTKSKELAEGFCFIVRSLGGKATLSECYKSCQTGYIGKYYTIYWRLNCELPLVLKYKNPQRNLNIDYCRRVIKDIILLGEEETVDITVDHPDHNFIGENWIVTGNSGKTMANIVEVCWAALGIDPYNKYPEPPLQIRFCTVDFNAVYRIALPYFKRFLYPWAWGHFRKEPPILTLKNGTEIEFKSYESDLESYEGTSRALCAMDEEPPLDVYQSNFMRTLDVGGKLIISCTPLHGLSWLYYSLYDNAEAVPPAVEHWHVKTSENPHIDKKEIEAVKADPAMRDNIDAALHGEFVARSGLVLKSFDSSKHCIDPLKVSDDHMILVGIDPHDRNPWGVVFVALNRENEYIVYDEILQEGTVSDIAPLIKAKLKGRTPQLIVIDTAANASQATSGKSIKEQLLSYGLYCVNAEKDVQAGILMLNSLFDPGGGTKPKLYITRNCVNLLRQIRHLVWDDWSRNRDQKDPKERILKRDDHLCDSLRYVVMLPVVYRHPGYRAVPRSPSKVSPVTGYF